MDKRRLWSNGRVAHTSLEGKVEAARFCEGARAHVSAGKSPLLDAPDGTRMRELLYGEPFVVLEAGETHAFGFAERDGYAGYIARTSLFDSFRAPTHVVDAPRSYFKGTPDLKTFEPIFDLSFGSFVEVLEEQGAWAGIAVRFHDAPGKVWTNWMPAMHLRPVGTWRDDPVDVAESFLGTPYLWGGNSAFGVDCSGLVQTALLSCGTACPGDSDMQEAELGRALPEGEAPARGDLIFWRGHVAMCMDADRIIHATAAFMQVVIEDRETAIERIAAAGEGMPTSFKRLT